MCKTPVQNIEDIRQRTAILLNDPEYESISWVGLYGSFARSTHSTESDVDLVIGYRPDTPTKKIFLVAGYLSINGEDAFGREAEFLHMIQQEVESYVMLEALLTCVTVYGSEEWPRRAQEDARKFLDDGYRRLKETYSLLLRIQDLVAKTDKKACTIGKSLTVVIHIMQRRNHFIFGEADRFEP